MRTELIVFLEILIGLFGLCAGQSLVKKDADLLLEESGDGSIGGPLACDL